jgi:hypothetical protein
MSSSTIGIYIWGYYWCTKGLEQDGWNDEEEEFDDEETWSWSQWGAEETTVDIRLKRQVATDSVFVL